MYDSATIEKSSCLNNIGNIYFHTLDLKKSIEFHLKSLNIRKRLGYHKGVAKSLNNIGNVYVEMKEFDSAIVNYARSLDLKISLNEKSELPAVLHNIGWAYLKKGDLFKAEQYLLEAFEAKVDLSDSLSMAFTSNLLAELYLKKKEKLKGWYYVDLTNKLTDKFQLLEVKKLVLENTADYYNLTRNFQKESATLRELQLITDSLLNTEKVHSLAEMQIKYETDQKDLEISYLQRVEAMNKEEIVMQKRKVLYTVSALLILIIMVILILFLLLKYKKSKSQVEQLNQEMQHRIGNNLQLLSNVIKMKSGTQQSDSTEFIKSTQSRINAMAIVHQKLFAKRGKRGINVKEYFSELCEYIVHAFSGEDRLKIKCNVEPLKIDVDMVVYLGLIVNELITNAIKHGFHGSESIPIIRLNLKVQTKKHIFLEVRDNGSGWPDDLSNSSFGTKLIQTLTQQLKAESTNFN
ncbi:MAG: tetratricopeptide repeat protein, partial [Marinoscillum sp.]